MFAQERHRRITELLAQRQKLTWDDLRDLLAVSAATVRRDLQTLERAGRVVRTHGGVLHPDFFTGELHFQDKARAAPAAKDAMGACASRLIPVHATVFVDSGTTTLAAGRRLLARNDLTVFTNSLPLLSEPRAGKARLIAIGGELREPSRAFVGGLAMEWLSHLRFDFAVLGASGLDPEDGASTTELTEAAVKKDCAARARRVILVCDATKWRHPASVRFASWDSIDDWVTNCPLTKPELQHLTKAGVTVHTVSA
ncbi:MAG TPA: DeoR/GlpR family DNA-binding transcription regulator [Opitutaceae bacterium]|nr:DeoR/GlpR transcriptional regulator [Opitutaceae bacterium]HRE04014.1 DeoR/GlpR family DNA-binding transcription regulator [Opitutaceae bacterium]